MLRRLFITLDDKRVHRHGVTFLLARDGPMKAARGDVVRVASQLARRYPPVITNGSIQASAQL